ncbi:MAG: helix-turn-helix transcriptional regulator [Sideroxydans sp.]|jgi:transcriptional regulator with XRE-family HTH domain
MDINKLEKWQIDDAARLKQIFERSEYTQEAFGIEFDIGNQAMVGQYLNAKRPLNLAAAGKFAYGLKVTIDEISPNLAAQIRSLSTLLTHEDAGYKPVSKRAEAAARIVDAMSSAQQDKAIKIVTALAEPEGNGGEAPKHASQ